MADYEHSHKYFIYQVKADFKPYVFENGDKNHGLYERIEYAYSGCNCGAAVKVQIKEIEDEPK